MLTDNKTTRAVVVFIPEYHIIIAAKATVIDIVAKFVRKLFVKMRRPLLNPDKGISHKIIGIIKRNSKSISIFIIQCKVKQFF